MSRKCAGRTSPESSLQHRRTAGPDHQHPSLPFPPPPPPALPLLPGIHVGARRSGPVRMGGGPRRPRGRKGKESGVLRTLTSPHRLLPGFAGGRGNKRPSWGSHCNLGRPSHAAEPDPSLSFCGWGCSHSERIQPLHGAQRAFHVSTQLFAPFLVPIINVNKNAALLLLYICIIFHSVVCTFASIIYRKCSL